MDGRSETAVRGSAGVVRPAASLPVSSGRPSSTLDELRAFLDHLLDLQCRLVDADAACVYLLSAKAETPKLLTSRLSPTRAVAGDLRAAMEDASIEQKLVRAAIAVASGGSGGGSHGRVEPVAMVSSGGLYTNEPTHRAVAAPLIAEGRVQGATVALLPGATGSAADELRLLELANQRFETFLLAKHARSESEQKLMLRQTLELLDRGQQAGSAGDMASVLCDELAQRFRCTRASIGMVDGHEIRVKAISAAPQLDRRTALSESLERVMEECAQQDTEIIFPTPGDDEADPMRRLVVREHTAFHEAHGRSSVLSLPLRLDGDLVGVIVLERAPHDPFPKGALPLVRLAAEFVGPALFTRRLADRGLASVAKDQAIELAETLVGPRYTGWKVLAATLSLILLLLAAVPIPSRVVCGGEVVAGRVRSITPPYAAFLDDVRVRPGDRVEQGQVMASLEKTELRLRLAESLARVEAALAERDDSVTMGELGRARLAEAELREARAAVDLLEKTLELSDITSPISGIVSTGDLVHAVGSRVEPAKALFEVIGDERHVVLKVPERSIARVSVGDTGWVATRSEPGRKIPIEVVRINPSSEAADGQNTFRVEAKLVDESWDPAALSAGVRVTSRVRDGWSTGLIELARPIVDEIRLKLWW